VFGLSHKLTVETGLGQENKLTQTHSSYLSKLLDSEMASDSQSLPHSEETSEQNSLLDLEISSPSWDDLIDFIIDVD
jgi:hypothetical protein